MPSLDEAAERWNDIAPLLKRATDRISGYEPIDLLRLVMLGKMALWLIEIEGRLVAAAVTEVIEYPRERTLSCPFIGGAGLRHWAARFLMALEDQARAAQCPVIVGYDRKGWGACGFEVSGVTLVRRVQPIRAEISDDISRRVASMKVLA
jgi:hypothetical protein